MFYLIEGSWGPIHANGKEIVKKHDVVLYINLSNGIPDFNDDIKDEIDALQDAINKVVESETNKHATYFTSGSVIAREYSYICSSLLLCCGVDPDFICPVASKKYPADDLQGLKDLVNFIKNPKCLEIGLEKNYKQEPEMSRGLLSNDEFNPANFERAKLRM